MLTPTAIFSGFAAPDLDAERVFFTETLGLPVLPNPMGFVELDLGDGHRVLIYSKDDHVPATYTVLNIEVADIDAAVDELTSKGVEMLRYPGMPADEKGILRGIAANRGPDIVWFTDPAGNILSVLQSA